MKELFLTTITLIWLFVMCGLPVWVNYFLFHSDNWGGVAMIVPFWSFIVILASSNAGK